MKKTGLKKFMALLLTGMLALSIGLLAGCGGGKTEKIKVWASSGDMQYVETWLKDFKTANPDFGYDIEVADKGEDNAGAALKDDPDAAADVIHIPHDQLGSLAEQGLVLQIPETHAAVKQVKDDNTATIANLGAYSGKYYGIPTIQETYVMYYDKSVFTNPDDVKTYESMKQIIQSKNNFYTVGMSLIDNGFYSGAFFLSVGADLYKDNVKANCTFNSANSYEMVKWMQGEYNKNKGIYSAAENIINGFDSSAATRIGAYVSGPWDMQAVKAKLGDNYAVAKLPTFDMGEGNNDVQLKSLGGAKLYVINAKSGAKSEGAIKVAQYLASKEIQAKRFTARGHFPTHTGLTSDPVIQSDVLSKALAEQFAFLVPQASLPAMSDNFYRKGHKKITVLFSNAENQYTPGDKGTADLLKKGLDELNAQLVE